MIRAQSLLLSLAVFSLVTCVAVSTFTETAFAHPKDAIFVAMKREESADLQRAIAYGREVGVDPEIQYVEDNLDLSELKDDGTLYVYSPGYAGVIGDGKQSDGVSELVSLLTGQEKGLKATFEGTIKLLISGSDVKPSLDNKTISQFKTELRDRGLKNGIVEWIAKPLVNAKTLSPNGISNIRKYAIDKRVFSTEEKTNEQRTQELIAFITTFNSVIKCGKPTVAKVTEALRSTGRNSITVVSEAVVLPKDAIFLSLDRSDEGNLGVAVVCAIKMGADPDIQFVGENLDLSGLRDNGTLYVYDHGQPGIIGNGRDSDGVDTLVAALKDPEKGLKQSFRGTIQLIACHAGTKPSLEKLDVDQIKVALKGYGLGDEAINWTTQSLKSGQFSSSSFETTRKDILEKKLFSPVELENLQKTDKVMGYMGILCNVLENKKTSVEKVVEALRSKNHTGITVIGPIGGISLFSAPTPKLEVLEDGVPPQYFLELSELIRCFYIGKKTDDRGTRKVLDILEVDARQVKKLDLTAQTYTVGCEKYRNLVSPKNFEFVSNKVVTFELLEEVAALIHKHLSKLDLERFSLPEFKGLHRIFKPAEKSFQRLTS